MATPSDKKLDYDNRERATPTERSSSTSHSSEIKILLQPAIKQWLSLKNVPVDERKAIGRTIRSAYRQGKTIDAIQGMELPASIKQLLKQQAVHLQKQNPRERLEQQLEKWCRQAKPDNIQQAIRGLAADKIMTAYDNQADQLDLQGMRLTSLPAALGKLTSLKCLLLSNNHLQTLPQQLKKLTQLQFVDCSYNQFSTLPKVLKTMAQLPSMIRWAEQSQQPSVVITNNPAQTESDSGSGAYNNQGSSALERGWGYELVKASLKEWSKRGSMDEWRVEASRLIRQAYLDGREQLDLSGLQLRELPSGLYRVATLSTLKISDNRLQQLPDDFVHFSHLKFLALENNDFIKQPTVLNSLPVQLIADSASQQALEQERENFLKSLQHWATGKCTPDGKSYDNIVNHIYQAYIHQASELDLSHLNLTSLPSVLTQLTHLKKLKINNNYLYSLPEDFNHLTQLESLDLANNGFDEIPEITEIPAVLKTMKLKLDIIDPWDLKSVSELKDLKDLKQRLKHWVHEVGQDSHQKSSRDHASKILLRAYAQKATEIQLNNLQLTTLPEGVFPKLSTLKSMVLINNQLQKLPKDFSQLSLENCSLASNQFSQFPKPLESIPTLKYLSLNHNQLTDLDQSAFNALDQLEHLDISHNKLKALFTSPISVDKPSKILQNLQYLNLDATGLSQLPEAILSLTALKVLSLEKNQLQEPPEALRVLPALRLLCIRDNPMLTGKSAKMAHQLVRDLSQWKNKRYSLSEAMVAFPQADQVKLGSQSELRLLSDTPSEALTRRTPARLIE